MTETRKGNWFQTYSGRVFWVMDPRAEDVCIEDIAHSLSLQCRYNGHTRKFYCPTPEQRVLTDDLQWVPAGDLRVGNGLLGFDENLLELGAAGKRRRRFRPARVGAIVPVRRRVIRLELADGSTVRSSAEHPWLVATKQSRNQRWLPAASIAAAIRDGRKRYMHHFIEPWTEEPGRAAGWIAGMADGEGYLSVMNRGGVQLGISQKPGPVLDELCQLLMRFGFRTSSCKTGTAGTITVQMRGGWRGVLAFLGRIRPLRLLGGFRTALHDGFFAKQLQGEAAPSEIIDTYEEGLQWVTGIESTTRTYLCEGYAAHNSVAQHSVMVSEAVLWRAYDHELGLWGLLHDAAEAYLGDMVRPLKLNMPEYRKAEARVMDVIVEYFGLSPKEPFAVKHADRILLATERRDLMPEPPRPWTSIEDVRPLPDVIDPWDPKRAEDEFHARFKELVL